MRREDDLPAGEGPGTLRKRVDTAVIDWGVASIAQPGEVECGDMHLVKILPEGALVAVVDGLGHGEEAAIAARTALRTLERGAGDSLGDMIRCCHQALRATRGAVMSLASFQAHEGTMTWLGVGNVEGLLLHAETGAVTGQETLMLRGGVVGDHLPPLADSVVPLSEGDLLVLTTDGLRSGFASSISMSETPQQIADRILTQNTLGTDDALVLVVRYVHSSDTESH